jgi:hypothetical protein
MNPNLIETEQKKNSYRKIKSTQAIKKKTNQNETNVSRKEALKLLRAEEKI